MTLGSVFLIALLQLGAPAPRYEALEDGLRVVVVEDHALPLVSVQLWYNVGSACDPPELPGMCSVARAVLGRRDDADLRLGGAGLAIGGETYPDACSFTTVLPPNFLEYVLSVEARRIRPVGVTADELSQSLDAAAIVSDSAVAGVENTAVRYVQREVFAGGPYEHTAGFVAALIAGVSTTDVDEFLQTWFTPRNATLFVIGDVSTPVVMDLVRTTFGEIPGGAAPQSPPRQSPPAAGTTFVAADLDDRTVAIAFLTPSLGMYENAAIDVLLQRVFDGSRDSYRAELNAIAGPLTGSARYEVRRWKDAGLLLILASFREKAETAEPDAAGPEWREVAPRVRELFVRELSRAATDIPSPVEFNRLRSRAVLAERPRWREFGSRASRLAEYEMIAGDLRLADFAVSRLRTVAIPDVQAAAAMLLESPCVVVYPATASVDSGEGAARSAADRSADAEKLPASIEKRGMRLDAEDVSVESLARLTAAAPPAVSPQRHPQIADVQITPFIQLRVCPVADPHWTSVATWISSARPLGELTWRTVYDTADEDVRKFRSYAEYHSIAAVGGDAREPDDATAGWLMYGDPEFTPAMLEWQAKLLRARFGGSADERPYVTIAAVGAVDVDELTNLARTDWADWQSAPSATVTTRQAATEVETEESQASRPSSDAAFRWIKCGDGLDWVLFSIDAPSGLDFTPTETDARILAFLCGATPHSMASGAGKGADIFVGFGGGAVGAVRVRCDLDLESLVVGVAERLKRVREWRIERSALESALRIAGVEELLGLDSTPAILMHALKGEADPWLLEHSPDLEELRRRVIELARAARLDVRIQISDMPSEEERADLQNELNSILGSNGP